MLDVLTRIPVTGDNGDIIMWVVIGAVAVVALVTLAILRFRKK